MSRAINIYEACRLPVATGEECLPDVQLLTKPYFRLTRIMAAVYSQLKIFMAIAFLLLMPSKATAPGNNSLIILDKPAINPFENLMYAVGMVETSGNTLAFNELEEAAGVFQIRQVRVDEYNRRTGSNYTLADMFNYDLSAKVFLYFASVVGPYNFERIAKRWNGSGPMTELYWKRIVRFL